jgi:glycosyltransferase involved in cell wall biosynthesis
MKVLHCIHSVNPAGGGPIEFIRQVVQLHLRKGTDIEIVCLDSPDDPWVKDFPCKVHALGPGFLSYGFSWRWVNWIRDNRKKYSIVVVNGIWQYSSFGTWLALKDTDTPYVVFTHGMLDPWFKQRYPLKHLKKSLYWPFAEYWVLKDAKVVLFTSEEERLLSFQSFPIYECNQMVIGYGAASPPAPVEAMKKEFAGLFPDLANKRVFLFLGRVHEKKGIDLLLQAFAKVLTDPDFHLMVAGPAMEHYLSRLKDLASTLGIGNRVTWTGMIDGNTKWASLCNAEALVLPSHQENFGVVVAEALACNVPVLISNKVNIWREILSSEAGFVANDTLEGTEEMLKKWLDLTEADRSQMKENAGQCFQRYFDVEMAFRRLMVLFRELSQVS